MNELLFFIEILSLVFFTLIAMRHSKEALVTWIVLQGVFANLFVLKEISFFGLSVTPTDPFAVSALFSLNLLQEKWGRLGTKGILPIQTIAFLFVVVISYFQLQFVPTQADVAHDAYAALLGYMPRIMVASLVTMLVVQRIDMALYQWLKGRLSFFWRNLCSLLVSQTIDTLLFTFIGLFGLLSSPFDLILLSLIIKGIVILTVAPFTKLVLHGKPIPV